MSSKLPAKTKKVQGKEITVKGSNITPKWNYSKSIEDPSHIKLKPKYDLFIDGKWQKTAKYFNTINPATEEVIAKVASAEKKMSIKLSTLLKRLSMESGVKFQAKNARNIFSELQEFYRRRQESLQ